VGPATRSTEHDGRVGLFQGFNNLTKQMEQKERTKNTLQVTPTPSPQNPRKSNHKTNDKEEDVEDQPLPVTELKSDKSREDKLDITLEKATDSDSSVEVRIETPSTEEEPLPKTRRVTFNLYCTVQHSDRSITQETAHLEDSWSDFGYVIVLPDESDSEDDSSSESDSSSDESPEDTPSPSSSESDSEDSFSIASSNSGENSSNSSCSDDEKATKKNRLRHMFSLDEMSIPPPPSDSDTD